MKGKAYPKYKKSGVEWLGEVPEHWEVKRLKTSAKYWVSNVDKVPNEDELPVRLCNYTDVYYNDFISSDMELMETTATFEEIKKFHLEVGDVVITKDSEEWDDIANSSLVVKTTPEMVCGYHLAMIRPIKDILLGKYLARQFQSSAINHQFQITATGVTRYGLPKSAIGEAIIPLPLLPEQEAIAAFLDCETERIDSLICKKQRLMELLKEKRTALISNAVTKGLDASIRMKSSDVEWLGEVPEHWASASLKWVSMRYSGGTPDKTIQEYWEDGTIPWLNSGAVNDGLITEPSEYITEEAFRNSSAKWIPKDALVMALAGQGKTKGMVGQLAFRTTCNQSMAAIIPDKRVFSRFLYYWLTKNYTNIRNLAGGDARDGLNLEMIGAIPVPFLPLPEQQAIADFLDCETAKIDTLVSKVNTAIEKLKEYRTALISAAVTGKIDVRGGA